MHRKGTPLLEIAEDTGYSPATVNAKMNVAKLINRYPDGFDAERSINRK